jgi:hypothetical protein
MAKDNEGQAVKSTLYDRIGPFTTIPNSILELWPKIGVDGMALFLYLRWRTHSKYEIAFPSYDTIQAETRLTRQRISKAIQTLEKVAILECKRRFGNSTIYILKLPPISLPVARLADVGKLEPKGSDKPVVHPPNDISLPVEPSLVHQSHAIKIDSIKKESIKTLAAGGAGDFVAWYLQAMAGPFIKAPKLFARKHPATEVLEEPFKSLAALPPDDLARVLAYAGDRLDRAELNGYAHLADEFKDALPAKDREARIALAFRELHLERPQYKSLAETQDDYEPSQPTARMRWLLALSKVSYMLPSTFHDRLESNRVEQREDGVYLILAKPHNYDYFTKGRGAPLIAQLKDKLDEKFELVLIDEKE